jgi:glycosyltransferase involved in cell wall biosynthesis
MTHPAATTPLRLALVSSGLGYTVRGIEHWMLDLANHLPKDVDVELWPGGPLSHPRRPVSRCFSWNRDSRLLRRLPWGRRYHFEQLSQIPSVLWRIRRFRPDIIYSGDPGFCYTLHRLRRWHRSRIVFMNGMRLSASWARPFDGVHLLADAYLAEARTLVTGPDSDRFFAVPHFTNVTHFRPPSAEERQAARSRLGLPASAFVVLTIGPVGTASRKRLDHLAAEVAAAVPNAQLIHAGADEDGAAETYQAVNAALGERVRWLGKVDRSVLLNAMHASDAYSLGSLGEPFSIAILEALAAGLPVVHHADTVMTWQSGQGGVAVSMTEVGAAASAFRQLANDPGRRQTLSTSARLLAIDRYSPEPVCASLISHLQRIAATPPRS